MAEQTDGDSRYGRKFGDMTLFGNEGGNFLEKPIAQQVLEIAWSEGCPVPQKVVKKYGAETATKRYAEIIFADRLIREEVKKHNPSLHKKLTEGINRKPGEPVGVHEPQAVPSSYQEIVPPPDTPWGFSLKRVLIDQFGKREERTQERILKGLEILENLATQKIDSPLEFLAKLAEEVIKTDGDSIQVMKNTLSKGHLDEQNFHALYAKLAEELKQSSPTFREEYNKLTPQERDKLGIAEVNLK